jgi:TonB family protein
MQTRKASNRRNNIPHLASSSEERSRRLVRLFARRIRINFNRPEGLRYLCGKEITMKNRVCSLTTFLLALSLGFTQTTFSDSQKDSSKIDPKAEQVVRELSEYLRGLKSFRVDITTSVKTKAQGMNMEMKSSRSLAVRRPDRFALVPKEGVEGATVICDGKKVYTYLPEVRKYTVQEAPKALDSIMMLQMEGTGVGSDDVSIGSLLRSNPYEVIMKGVIQGQYLGMEEIDGVECHHLKFFEREIDWEMWVEVGDKPLIKRNVPDISKTLAKNADLKGMGVEASVTFTNWAVNVDLPDDQFVFTPPASAKKVDSFFGGELTAPLAGKDPLPLTPPQPEEPPPPQPSVKPAQTPRRVSEGVLQGSVIRRVPPAYPPIARSARVSGTVSVEVVIDESGNVIQATVVDGHPSLRQSALDAAKQWKFRPILLSGQPIKVVGVLIFNFRL